MAVGIFEEGLIIKRKRSADVINAVKLQIMEKTGIATETGCKTFELKDTFIFVSPSKLVQLEHIFHNCKYASCRVTKTNSNEMGIVRHRNVNSYIWNQFKLWMLCWMYWSQHSLFELIPYIHACVCTCICKSLYMQEIKLFWVVSH